MARAALSDQAHSIQVNSTPSYIQAPTQKSSILSLHHLSANSNPPVYLSRNRHYRHRCITILQMLRIHHLRNSILRL